MKRILNLNDFSLPALKVILIIGLLLPAVFYGASRLLELAGWHLPVLVQIALFLLKAGVFLLLLFFLLVVVEQIQDQYLYNRYLEERGKEVQGECPYCGNRQLHQFEHFCHVCGKEIRMKGGG